MATFGNKFNSIKQDWVTPDYLFNSLNNEFGFDTDLAASAENKKCSRYYSKENNAFKNTWSGICWLNPPYGDKQCPLSKWVEKSYNEALANNSKIVLLIPARTNTAWWHKFCMRSEEIRFLLGRPKFNNSDHGLPQPLSLVVFSNIHDKTKYSTYDLKSLT